MGGVTDLQFLQIVERLHHNSMEKGVSILRILTYAKGNRRTARDRKLQDVK